MSGDEVRGDEASERDRADTLARVDHLVFATPDLDDTVDRFTTLLGVCAVPGGSHPSWGTRNALVALGKHVYLEIVGPDSEAPPPEVSRPFGLDQLSAPRLATWAVRGRALDALVAEAAALGVELGDVQRRARRRPDGVLLGWSMTDCAAPRAGGIVPFFIDWGESPHPAATSPLGGSLVGLRARHPEPAEVRTMLGALGLTLDVEPGESPQLIATLETLRGTLELL